ncbi:D-cysteine desulfhydrase family protein [Acidobacteriota bacterium]
MKRYYMSLCAILVTGFLLPSCRPTASVNVEGMRPDKHINASELEKSIRQFPSVSLSHLPTPLEYMPTLTRELKGPKIYIKRDDQTGLAFGGNKARKLDFIMADVLKKKSDVVITTGGIQSNWCRSTAAAARRLNVNPILVLFQTPDSPEGKGGNLLLDRIFGADVRIVELDKGAEADPEAIFQSIAEEEKQRGHTPYIIPVGGSSTGGSMTEPLGAISYTKAFLEIRRDLNRRKIKVDYIILASGSGGTQAGLVVGAKALGSSIKILGISLSREKKPMQENIAAIANETAKVLGLDITISPEEILVADEYIFEGYGILTKEISRAMEKVARSEGILLDPVYTGKAMAGLIDLANRNFFDKNESVVFLHTGGTPALFVYEEKILELIEDK